MKDKEVNLFLRAAEQRLTSAMILRDNGMWLDATYLGGYVAECAFKALILSRVPLPDRLDYKTEYFRGAAAHNYDYLNGLMRKLGVVLPLDIAKTMRKIASWSTDLRYAVGRGVSEESSEFLDSAKTMLNWAKRSI